MQILKHLFILAATPKQLDRGVSFVESNESLEDQNIAIAGHTLTGHSDYQFSRLPETKRKQSLF